MTKKRKTKFDAKSAVAVVAGGTASAGVAAGLAKVGASPYVVAATLGAAGLTGAAMLDGRARMALGAATGIGAFVALSAAMARKSKPVAPKQAAPERERQARLDDTDEVTVRRRKKKKLRDDAMDNVMELFERRKAEFALEDEERGEGSFRDLG